MYIKQYKGYYCDTETGMFWLSSRYYSPELCRFISQDSMDYLDYSSLNGLNLYCYCLNNPIYYVDPSGHFAISTFIIGALIGFASFGISEGMTLMGKKLLRGWFNKAANSTTKEASKQLKQFAKVKVITNLKPNAQRIISRGNLYSLLFEGGKKA